MCRAAPCKRVKKTYISKHVYLLLITEPPFQKVAIRFSTAHIPLGSVIQSRKIVLIRMAHTSHFLTKEKETQLTVRASQLPFPIMHGEGAE